MALDLAPRRPVAWLVVVVGAAGGACGPSVRPEAPGDEPTPSTVSTRPPPLSAGRSALVGELCPQGAGGRPAVAPLALRAVSWTSDREELVSILARGSAAQFTVHAVDGRRAGTFSAIGTADVGGNEVAIGSYVGAPPCSRPAAAVGGEVTGDAACLQHQKGCGLAVAAVGAPGGAFAEAALESPELALGVVTGGACRSGEVLAVDVDRDGVVEVFPLGAFVDAVRAPAEEVSAVSMVAPACAPAFALHGLAPPPAPGVVMDGKHKVELDVLGVLDVDGDGRHELVVAYRYVEGRTIAVYSAMSTAARLELVGELVPWP